MDEGSAEFSPGLRRLLVPSYRWLRESKQENINPSCITKNVHNITQDSIRGLLEEWKEDDYN